MVEKTYHIAPYLGAFGAYLMHQSPIYGSKGVSINQNNRWNVAVNSHYLPSDKKKSLVLVKNNPKRLWLRKFTIQLDI